MKYYYEPNDKWYDTKQELVDAYNEDFEGTHSAKVTIDNWTEEQWRTIWKPNMKKLEIKTEKATLLVVDLPLSANNIRHERCYSYLPPIEEIHFDVKGNEETKGYDYTDGFELEYSVKHLGKVSEITEEEWKGIVESKRNIGESVLKRWHKDYMFKNFHEDSFLFETATESGLSLLKANGILLENPLGAKPMYDEIISKNLIKQGYGSNDFVDVLYDLHQYESAQEKVWSNPHVFIKTL